MTPSELHSRILLHELRTILLDPTRAGSQIPEAWKTLLQSDPHNPANYLVLADELDEQGDDLAELCRIQVELIGLLPVNWITSAPGKTHPFRWDWAEWATNDGDKTKRSTLLEMRMLLTETLYEEKEIPTILDENLLPRLQSRPLGRSTRMLTDILRYCALNQGKHVLVRGQDLEHLRGQVDKLADELLGAGGPGYAPPTDGTRKAWGNTVHFGRPGMTQLIRTARIPAIGHIEDYQEIPAKVQDAFQRHNPGEWQISFSPLEHAYLGVQTRDPDITFTDHACEYTFPRRVQTVEQVREQYNLPPEWLSLPHNGN